MTRIRGREAASKIVSYIKTGDVIVDLSKADLVSLSFLDELIGQLADSVEQGKIKFCTNDRNTRLRLSTIAYVRSLSILCATDCENAYKPVPKKHIQMPVAEFAPSKGLLAGPLPRPSRCES